MFVSLYDPIKVMSMDSYLSSKMIRVYHETELDNVIVDKTTQLILQLNQKNANGNKIYIILVFI